MSCSCPSGFFLWCEAKPPFHVKRWVSSTNTDVGSNEGTVSLLHVRHRWKRAQVTTSICLPKVHIYIVICGEHGFLGTAADCEIEKGLQMHTHTCVHAHAHTHTHTHIHMHTLSFILSISIYTFSHPIFQLQLIAERTDRATARATKRAKDAPDVGDGQQQDEQPKSAGVYPFTVYSCAHVLQMTSSLQCQKRCSPILTWPKQQGCSHVCCSCLFHTTVLTLTLVWVHTSTASTLTPSVRKPPHVCKPGEWVSGTCAPCGYV